MTGIAINVTINANYKALIFIGLSHLYLADYDNSENEICKKNITNILKTNHMVIFLIFSFFLTSLIFSANQNIWLYFWEKNRIWGAGSSLILFSVLHARFFDIESNSKKLDERGGTILKKDERNPKLKLIEQCFKHI